MRAHRVAALLLAVTTATAAASGPDLFGHTKGIWEIPGTADKVRWVVIHGLEDARRTGVFHVEVLARQRTAPTWQVEHVAAHLAITAEALAKSVVRPLPSGAVYPETFDDAYARWQRDAAAGQAAVCTTSLLECIGGSQ